MALETRYAGAADRHQVHGLVVLDRVDRDLATLALAHHAEQTRGFEHLAG